MAVLLNDGTGMFGSPTFFDSGCDGEWGLASGDLNGDGITDLVVGCVGDEKIAIMLGNGNAHLHRAAGARTRAARPGRSRSATSTATAISTRRSRRRRAARAIPAAPCSSATATARSARRATFDDGGHTPATDLGDLDGDGDLDWLLSGFGGRGGRST